MASRNQQSHAKRARELAVKEKRERKRAKKAARLAGEPWGEDGAAESGEGEDALPGEEAQAETTADAGAADESPSPAAAD